MKINLALIAPFLLIIGSTAPAQEPKVKKVPAKPTVSVAGKDLFRQYCAVCHGTDGTGGGPAAGAMKTPPTDLTAISRNNGGRFPDERVMKVLRGEQSVVAHGTKDMPVWGNVLNNMTPNLQLVQTRLHALREYLESIQQN